MCLDEVRHQERALAILRRALRSGRVSHAYLFEGPEGVGKEMTARALTARWLCESDRSPDDWNACTSCTACRLFTAQTHPDFHLIDRGLHKQHPDPAIRHSKGLFLGVGLIRHFLIEPAGLRPNLAERRVFLIREAERMNEEAQNALLKTLEEPPGRVTIILLTTSALRLLPTIRSRCQAIPFGFLPRAFVTERLVAGTGVDPVVAHSLAHFSGGRLGTALRWHRMDLLGALPAVADALLQHLPHDPETFAKSLLETARRVAARGEQPDAEPVENDSAVESFDDRDPSPRSKSEEERVGTDRLREALKLLLMLVAGLYRDALLTQAHADEPLRYLPQSLELVDHLAARHDALGLTECITAVARAEEMIDRNVSPQLVCERLAVAQTDLLWPR